MFGQTLSIGIGILVAGLVAVLFVYLLLRMVVPRLQPVVQETIQPSFTQVQPHQNALMAIEPGGRIRYLNRLAQDWFGLIEGEIPNLERLGRRVRPSEKFLELCATEGQARFSLNGRLVDAYSYQMPGNTPMMVLTMRQTELSLSTVETGQQESLPVTALRTVSEFGQEIASSLSLETTLESILTNVERLVACDFLEVKVWDGTNSKLIPYRMAGPPGTTRMLQQEQVSQFGNYETYLLADREDKYVPDTRNSPHIRFDPDTGRIPPMGSYIGVPLAAGGDLVGTLEIGVTPINGLSDEDLNIVRLITGQAAIAIRNARLYEVQQRWNSQLFGLASLAQTVGTLHDLKDLFTRLVDGLSPLFDVQILGFLMYDEQRHSLEGQMPFFGLPDSVVQIYKTTIAPNSPGEERLLKQEIISTKDAAQDSIWAELGLRDVSQAASIHDTALIPLVSSGRFVGYLQLSNHKRETTALTQDELQLLNIVANQVAAMIDNALLVQQARQRSQRSEAMRRIANLVSSSATLDEILRYSIQELTQLLQADSSAIFLVDESEGIMRAHIPSAYGVPEELQEAFSKLYVKPAAYRLTVAASQRPFMSGNLSKDRRVLMLYRAIVRRLKLESALVVPLIVGGEGIGELLIGAHQPDLFNNYDLQIASTAAGQLAVAIEASRHVIDTEESLRRRADQMDVVSRITREINTTSNLREMLNFVYSECLRVSHAECGSVLLYAPDEELAETHRVMMHLGHSPSGQSPVQYDKLECGDPVVVPQVDSSSAPHSDVASLLVCPICYQGESVGVIELHSSEAAHFDPVMVDTVRIIAVQTAIAVDNLMRFREQQKRTELFHRRADTLLKIFETDKNLLIDQPLANTLEVIAHGIQEATPFEVVVISLNDVSTGVLQRVAAVGLDDETLRNLKGQQQSWSSVSQLLKPEFEIGNLFLIPHDQVPVIPSDVQMATLVQQTSEVPNAWNPQDLLLIPIYDYQNNPLGLISVESPRDGLRPDRPTMETLEVFATQAALTIISGRQIVDYNAEIGKLSTEVHRQENLLGFSQQSLPMLLHKDLEQTILLSYLNQRARHIRAGLQLTEAISRQLDVSSAFFTLGQQALVSFDMSISLVARETPDGPRIIHIMGNLPRGANPETSFGQRNPLRVALQTGETLISTEVDEDEFWHDTPFLIALHAKSFVCIPVVINEKPIAAVLTVDSEAMPALTAEDRQVYLQISRQLSVTLQNVSLLNETRQRLQEVNLLLDFSRHLSGLDPKEIVHSLLDSALRVVSPAHAGVALLLDPQLERLVPQAASNYVDDDSILEIEYHLGEGLPGRVFAEKTSLRVDEVNFAIDYNLPAENLLKYRKATGGRLPVSSLLMPIRTSERDLGVLVLDNFNTPAAFREDDEALLLSLTQQVALSLENVRLVQATQERAGQLQALNDVAATISSSLQYKELVSSLLERMKAIIPYDTAILWLREEDQMIIAEARGFDDNEQRIGLSVNVADSVLLNEMTRSGQAIAVADVRSDARFPSLVEPSHLSWLGIPLITKGQVIGVIAVEKTEPTFYGNEQVQLSATFASQAAIALDNARLFEESLRRAAELDERSQRLALINEFSSELGGSLNADQVLKLTVNQMISALGTERAMIMLVDSAGKPSLINILPDESNRPAMYRPLPASPIFERLRESMSVFTTDNISAESDLAPLSEFIGNATSALLLPIASGQHLYVILSESMETRRFTSTEIEMARTLGNQAAIALENADLYQSTLATAERLAILNQVSYDISSSLDPENIYKAVHDAVSRLMPVDAFVVALLDEEAQDVEATYVVDMGQRISDVRLPLGHGLSGRVIETGEPILTLDAQDAEQRGGVTIGEKGTPHSIIAVPMFSAGKVIGALSAQSYQFNAYSEDYIQILSTLANQATVAIQNARLFAETQKLAATMEQRVVERTAALEHEQRNTETLLRILTEVSASLDLDRALSRTLGLLNEAIGAEQGTIMLLNLEDNMLHYRAGYGYVSDSTEQISMRLSSNLKLKIGEGLAGWVVKHRQSVLVEDLYKDSRWVVSQGSQQHRSAVVAPLVVGEDVIGAIMVFHRKVSYFTDDTLEMVQAIGSQVAISINNAQLYELIRDQAERLGSMLRSQQVEASRQTAILEAVADGVLVTDPANKITFINVSVERILGLRAAQLVDRPLGNFAGLFGKSTQTWIQTVHEWSDNPEEQRPGETFAEQIGLENGKVVLVHLAPVIWQNEFLGTVSIFRDITHEVEVDRLKSEFVATVSHELRTPMTSIRGYVDILLMGAAGALSEQQTHFLDIVKGNTERLNILVNDLLDISRIEAGRVMLSLQAVDMHEVADEIVADVVRRSQEENKPMDVKVKVEKNLPRVLADPERVRQIMGNLVGNAYNYTPADGNITVQLHRVDGTVQIDVMDTGIGVSPDSQDQVFERFFRGEDPMVLATPGTGLGLSIVKQLVEMHHGKIWMQSKGTPGEGSTFSFTLPVEE